jgi:AcrR family transcriptional regulator
VSRSGRRPGTSQTRDEILAVARGRFADRGYDAISLRSIASEAEVDPALVIHYFGSKESLFVEAMGMPEELPALFRALTALDTRDRLEALVRGYVRFSDSDDSRNAIIALVRSAMSSEKAAAMLREFMTAELLPAVAGLTAGSETGPETEPDAWLRASLVAAQLIGVAMLRHVVKIEPLAKATPDEIVSLIVPVIEGYFR